jgi:hypothetical protein
VATIPGRFSKTKASSSEWVIDRSSKRPRKAHRKKRGRRSKSAALDLTGAPGKCAMAVSARLPETCRRAEGRNLPAGTGPVRRGPVRRGATGAPVLQLAGKALPSDGCSKGISVSERCGYGAGANRRNLRPGFHSGSACRRRPETPLPRLPRLPALRRCALQPLPRSGARRKMQTG